jgi:hypothetical protein
LIREARKEAEASEEKGNNGAKDMMGRWKQRIREFI